MQSNKNSFNTQEPITKFLQRITQKNGLTERFNQTLQATLITFINRNQNDWDEHLSALLFAFQTSVQKATKLTPFEVMCCR